MNRFRSPYTVNVYGAVTVMQDRLVLVMELLSAGDLRTMLSNCEHPLPEQQSCQIIGDICPGMAFLKARRPSTATSNQPTCFWTGSVGRR